MTTWCIIYTFYLCQIYCQTKYVIDIGIKRVCRLTFYSLLITAIFYRYEISICFFLPSFYLSHYPDEIWQQHRNRVGIKMCSYHQSINKYQVFIYNSRYTNITVFWTVDILITQLTRYMIKKAVSLWSHIYLEPTNT